MARKKSLKKMLQKKWKEVLQIVLAALIFINIGNILYANSNNFFVFNYWERYEGLERVYLSSQYVNKNPEGWIPDNTVFSYAGGALIQGENPIYVIPDAPPLGKYIIGLSALLFNNENILIVLVLGLASVGLLYLFAHQILRSRTLALFVTLLFTLEPIFANQFRYVPLFELAQLSFLLAMFYLFNMALKKKGSALWIYAGISTLLGVFISTKFFASGVPVTASMGGLLLLKRKWKKVMEYSLTVPLTLSVLLGSYLWVLTYGHTLRELLGIQKWVFLYHTGQNVNFFSVWPMLLLNKVYTWWGDYSVISDPQWQITWPLITFLSFIAIILYILKKIPRRQPLEICMIWTVLYLLFLSTGTPFSRYLFLVLPIMYITSAYGISRVILKIVRRSE